MHIIKLSATNSTNSYLRSLIADENLNDFTAVITQKQTSGRGQMGTVWNAKAGKNLTFSVFKDVSGFYLEHPFYISMVTALALIKTLNFFGIPKISVKWPNDILSENKKICGVLIENVIKNNKMTASILGMGLNVNQTEFENLPKASSLKIITGRVFNIDEVAITIINNLKFYFEFLQAGNITIIKNEYVNYLFRKNKPSTFLDAEGCMFSGFIKGVTNTGNLKVLVEDGIVKTFDLKEIQLLY